MHTAFGSPCAYNREILLEIYDINAYLKPIYSFIKKFDILFCIIWNRSER